VHGINYYGRGSLSHDPYVKYIKHYELGKDLFNATLTYVPSLKSMYINLTRSMADYGNIQNWSSVIILNKKQKPSVPDAINYYDSMSLYVDELRKVQNCLRNLIRLVICLSISCCLIFYGRFSIREEVNKYLHEASNGEAIGFSILIVVLIVSPVIIILVRNAVATIQVSL
jgi:hypothetical protein